MSDTKLLQGILNGQAALREEMNTGFSEVNSRIDKLDIKIDGVEERLTNRIDKIGSQLAYLEDDAPTREEHDNLEKRVAKVEKVITS